MESLDSDNADEEINIYRTKRSQDMSDIIKAQIVPDAVYVKDFEDEQVSYLTLFYLFIFVCTVPYNILQNLGREFLKIYYNLRLIFQ